MNEKSWPVVPLAFIGFLLLPLYWLATLAFKTDPEILRNLTFWPREPTIANIKTIFTERDWWMGYVHAAIYVAMSVALSIGAALPAAYAFSRGRFWGRRPLFFGFLLFRLIAPVILVVPFVEIFYDLGLFDTHLAVALAHCYFNVPIAVWILEGAISAVPREMDESALVDGHSFLGFFGRVLIPTIAPSIAVATFFCFIFSWVEYVLASALTATQAKPINGILTRVANIAEGDYGQLAAASLIGLIPGLICIYALRRHLIQGFALGRTL
jgi:glycerol transport system permease protein